MNNRAPKISILELDEFRGHSNGTQYQSDIGNTCTKVHVSRRYATLLSDSLGFSGNILTFDVSNV